MKKTFIKIIFAFAVALTVCLSAVTPAFADAGGYEFQRYKVVVSNTDGAKIFDGQLSESGSSIPYNTEVEVFGEYEYGDELYLWTFYESDRWYIKSSDVVLKNEVFLPQIEQNQMKKRTIRIEAEDGVVLKKGPSEIYDEICTIPKGTILESEFGDDKYQPMYIFVEYNGKSGWFVSSWNNDLICSTKIGDIDEFTGKITVLDENCMIYDAPFDDEFGFENNAKPLTGKIPAGTELEFEFYFAGYGNRFVYTSYNGVSGWLRIQNNISDDLCLIDVNTIVMLKKGANLYLGYVDDSIPITVDEDTVVFCDKRKFNFGLVDDNGDVVYRETDNWCRVYKDGKYYWAHGSDFSRLEYTVMSQTAVSDIYVFAEPKFDEEPIAKIARGEKCYTLFHVWNGDYGADYIVFENGVKGWTNSNDFGDFYDNYFTDIDEFVVEALGLELPEGKMQELAAKPVEDSTTADKAEAETPVDANGGNKIAPSKIIFGCVAGVAVVALTAAVTIVLINKKKKGSANSEL